MNDGAGVSVSSISVKTMSVSELIPTDSDSRTLAHKM